MPRRASLLPFALVPALLAAAPEEAGPRGTLRDLERGAQRLAAAYRRLGLRAEIRRLPGLVDVRRREARGELGFGDQVQVDLRWGRDVEAQGGGANGEFRFKPLIFGGYGLSVPGHDDYQGLEYRGRAVMILRRLPEKGPLAELPAPERALATRIRRLADLGVAAVILLEEGAEPAPLAPEQVPLPLPVLSMPLSVAAKVCADLPERAQRLRETGQPQSRDYVYAPWSFLNLELELKRVEAGFPVVVATLPGRDPALRRERVLLSAPLDPPRAADPEAPGFPPLLELARRLKVHPPKRTVTFLHLPGEEDPLEALRRLRPSGLATESTKFLLHFEGPGPEASRLRLRGLGVSKEVLDEARSLGPQGLELAVEAGAVDLAGARIPTLRLGGIPRTDPPAQGPALLAGYACRLVCGLAERPRIPAFDPSTPAAPPPSSGALR